MENQTTFKNLSLKINKAYTIIDGVAKRGVNKSQGYKFQQSDDVIVEVRKALVEVGIVIVTQVNEVTERVYQTNKGGEMVNVKVKLGFTIMDPESGEFMYMPWVAEASDTGDKAVNKAITAGCKYFLIKMFWIPIDEEDADASDMSREKPKDDAKAYIDTLPLTVDQKKKFVSECASIGADWRVIVLSIKNANMSLDVKGDKLLDKMIAVAKMAKENE